MLRRKFIQAFSILTGLGFLTGLYTWQVEPFWLEFVKKEMPIKNLPDDLVGKTLMQISDIHVGNRFDWNFLIESFEKAQALNPDFVVYTGDYVSYKSSEQLGQLEIVLKKAVKGKYGTLGILGNHDYGKNWAEPKVAESISEILRKSGVEMLRNDKKVVNGLAFLGLDDYWGLNFAPEKAMSQYDEKEASIALCHNPDVADLDVWQGYKGWILSGHTHGGQCKPPFLPAPMLPVKNKNYAAGEVALEDGRTLYINRALGHLWQVRFNVRPEITVFELRKG